MITPDTVKSAIYDLLRGTFPPSEDVHLDLLPANFTRPCVYLTLRDVVTKDVNCTTVEESCQFEITCFVQMDDYGNSPENDLSIVCEKVRGIFRTGTIAVADRAIKCIATCKNDVDIAQCRITATYWELRKEAATQQTMQDIKIKTKGEG